MGPLGLIVASDVSQKIIKSNDNNISTHSSITAKEAERLAKALPKIYDIPDRFGNAMIELLKLAKSRRVKQVGSYVLQAGEPVPHMGIVIRVCVRLLCADCQGRARSAL
jgi:hypothetical protein